MMNIGNKPGKDERRLREIFERLGKRERESLLDFAEFLAARCPAETPEAAEPRHTPRPEKESVVAAIKRLSATYYMIDRSKLLHETSGLMAQHVMQGRDAADVIDELELIFQRHYEKQFGEKQFGDGSDD